MKFKPPKGTRDFLPEEMIKREFVIEKIKRIFTLYGFDPLETPIFEDWNLLTKKCGEDIKEQIYKFEDKAGRKLGLRFDLTVGMARVVASNPQLPKPFKRYCIAPAWRYEDVSTGRKREFVQADIDIVGVKGMEAEAECLACAVDCLKALGFDDFEILINNRKILDGFLELAEIPSEKNLDVFRAVDKLEKIGEMGVRKELERIGLEERQIKKLLELISIRGKCQETLKKGRELLRGVKVAEEGLNEIEEIFRLGKIYGFSDFLTLDFSLARGLDYYTGPIFEVKVKTSKQIGSIAGGGRYDELIELLGGTPTPATGISLGIERIVEIMKAEEMFKLPKTRTKVFVANVNEEVKEKAIRIAQDLRRNGIECQVDLMGRNLTRQLEYADSLGIPFVIIIGPKELKEMKVKVRDMEKKSETEVNINELIGFLKNLS